MQIYADVMNMDLKIAASAQAPALGAAIFGAVVGGIEAGGYAFLSEAAKQMGRVREQAFHSIPKNVLVYNRLFKEYQALNDYLGRGENDVLKCPNTLHQSVKMGKQVK
jgi:L-ribulokinase